MFTLSLRESIPKAVVVYPLSPVNDTLADLGCLWLYCREVMGIDMESFIWLLVGILIALVIRAVVDVRPRRITKDELMAMVDELFIEEYNMYREEALRRSK